MYVVEHNSFTPMKCPILSPISNQTPFVRAKSVKAGFWHFKTRFLFVVSLFKGLSMSDHNLNVFLRMLMSPDIGGNVHYILGIV